MLDRYISLKFAVGLACCIGSVRGETIVSFGDSTTAPRNVGATNNGRPAGLTSLGLNQTDPDHAPHNTVTQVDETSSQLYVYSDMLRDRLTNSPFALDFLDNEGIGGNRTDQGVTRLGGDVIGKEPETVIVQFGINDSAHDAGPGTASRVPLNFHEQTGGDDILGNGNDHPFAARGNYTDNLTQIVQSLRQDDLGVILMTPNQIIDYSVVTNTRLSLYAQVVRDVAATESVQLVDVWQIYARVSGGGDISNLLLDNVHPNGSGHQLVSDALFHLIDNSQPPNGVVGDVNQDGVVFGDGTGPAVQDDVTAFVQGWRTTGHVGALEMYTHGDLNFDGITNLPDAFILHEAFRAVGSSGLDFSLLNNSPEPGGLALLAAGVLVISMKRHRGP